MPDNPLVSIITPCYNGERFLDRYFNSVLQQTYSNIELIFINDGSTDRTGENACSYRKKLENRGIKYHYVWQENKGAAGAINAGLKVFTGFYLTWPDSDDWMTPDCIEKKVKYLNAHPEKALVQCGCAFVSENDVNTVLSTWKRNAASSNNRMFDDLILERNVLFAPGTYMVRSKQFIETHPTRHIFYENRAGQNYQMLLPLLYRYECGFIDDVLYYYVVSPNSHSRREKDYESNVEKTRKHQEILEHVLDEINMSEGERQQYLQLVEDKYIRRRMQLAAKFQKKDDLYSNYKLLQKKGALERQDRLLYIRTFYPPLDFCLKTASKGKQSVQYLFGRAAHAQNRK